MAKRENPSERLEQFSDWIKSMEPICKDASKEVQKAWSSLSNSRNQGKCILTGNGNISQEWKEKNRRGEKRIA